MKPKMVGNPNWIHVPNSKGPWTMMKKNRTDNNAFQVSWNENQSGRAVVPPVDLEQLSRQAAEQLGGQPSKTYAGKCAFGRYGTSTWANSRYPHCQVWLLTNEIHFITATHFCDQIPSENERHDVEVMALSLTLKEEEPAGRSWWPFVGSQK